MIENIQIKFIEPIYPSDQTIYKNFSKAHWDTEVSGDDGNVMKEKYFRTSNFVTEARFGAELVGLIYVFIGDLLFDNRSILYAGLGGVLTHKDFRHRGIATVMTKATIQELTKRGVKVALLGTEIETIGKVYAKAGFVPLNKKYSFINVYGEKDFEEGAMIAPCAGLNELKEILSSNKEVFVGIGNF